jgi:hypothetical protein
MANVQLAQLTDMADPRAVFEEVKCIFVNHYRIEEFLPVREAFNDFNDLYEGKYPGYRACNTRFHDKIHTTDALLAIARLIDGYDLNCPKLPVRQVVLALIATILHDAGYIQTRQDRSGTGAKYTLSHVQRSIDFLGKYFEDRGRSKKDFLAASRTIRCTGLATAIVDIPFADDTERLLGLMLGTADLLGQMSSRTYLERLIYLYREFREGHVKGYDSEAALLKKTLNFYADTRRRLQKTLDGVDRFAKVHFARRYRINENLYHVAIDRQIDYLREILKCRTASFRNLLKRKA